MGKNKEGSLVVVILGLFWLTGIMTALLYALITHISTLATMREIQIRYWYLLQGGMVTALAYINEIPDLYISDNQSYTLYEGLWNIDPRHPTIKIKLSTYSGNVSDQMSFLKGELFDDKATFIIVVWSLVYNQVSKKWLYQWGERIYMK